MKKLLLFLFIIILSILVACTEDNKDTESNIRVTTTDTSSGDEVESGHARITISLYDGEQYLSELEVPIEDGTLLLDVMEENFYIETNDNETEITSIERMAESEEEKTNWTYTVNGETPSVTVDEYELSSGDKIIFDLKELK
ncbi:DUF4430 domain-containing protein [Oceanobacillus piezotolerans]|uniref:DUF4430 domain-containing protein n=1 Tax=Oceanobacillus piezotolerans TaxID=2448030 RepID=A0A498DA09_9BACI|nr:DUF4430 domain-containing protein [Oceanobacillus piezotolerans]RLL48173.1 DUF4430 domain-containing protein [Oceanobacillus piezotolerans]